MNSELQPDLLSTGTTKTSLTPDEETTRQVLAEVERAYRTKLDVLDRRWPKGKSPVLVVSLQVLATAPEFEDIEADRLEGWCLAFTAERLDNLAYRQTGAGFYCVAPPPYLLTGASDSAAVQRLKERTRSKQSVRAQVTDVLSETAPLNSTFWSDRAILGHVPGAWNDRL